MSLGEEIVCEDAYQEFLAIKLERNLIELGIWNGDYLEDLELDHLINIKRMLVNESDWSEESIKVLDAAINERMFG